MAVEARAGLSLHRSSKLALERIGDERRELGGDARHAHDRNEEERGGAGEAPEYDLAAQPALDAAGAVDRHRPLVDCRSQLRVLDFEAREHGAAGSAET